MKPRRMVREVDGTGKADSMTLSPAVPLPTPTFQLPLLMTTGGPKVLVEALVHTFCVTCVTSGGSPVVSIVVTMRCSAPVKLPEGVATVQPVPALLSRTMRTISCDAAEDGGFHAMTSAARKLNARTRAMACRQRWNIGLPRRPRRTLRSISCFFFCQSSSVRPRAIRAAPQLQCGFDLIIFFRRSAPPPGPRAAISYLRRGDFQSPGLARLWGLMRA